MQAVFPIPQAAHITGLILAGGQARRLGGQDKGLIQLGNQQLIQYVLARFRPQVGELLINANRHAERYRAFGYPLVADTLPDFAGPLAGLLSGLQHSKTDWLVSVPCDNPWMPDNLVAKLVQTANAEQCLLTVAGCAGKLQPVYCLLHYSLQTSLAAYLTAGQHKVQTWIEQQTHAVAEFPDCREFENVNTAAQLAEAEKSLC